MNKKRLFGAVISWLLIVVMLTGCVSAPQITPQDSTVPGSSVVTVPSSTPDSEGSVPPSSTPTAPSTAPSTTPSTAPSTTPSTAPTTTPTTPATAPSTQPSNPVTPPTGSSFKIHFIDVGQADAMLVVCDGKTMLIDGGNAADSNLMYTYLKKNGITHLDYVIGTHAHEDHIGGIPGALQYATVDTVYCASTSYTTKAFKNFVKAVNDRGASITVPERETVFYLGSAKCIVLAVNTVTDDLNNTSIVLRIEYGSNSFLLMGDAGIEVEDFLLEDGAPLKADVLKVGHHGSRTATGYVFLRAVMPQYAVICVGTGNSYGHPTTNVLSRLRDADVTTFRTDKHGDVICVSDGRNITFTPSKNANINPYQKIGPNSTQRNTE